MDGGLDEVINGGIKQATWVGSSGFLFVTSHLPLPNPTAHDNVSEHFPSSINSRILAFGLFKEDWSEQLN